MGNASQPVIPPTETSQNRDVAEILVLVEQFKSRLLAWEEKLKEAPPSVSAPASTSAPGPAPAAAPAATAGPKNQNDLKVDSTIKGGATQEKFNLLLQSFSQIATLFSAALLVIILTVLLVNLVSLPDPSVTQANETLGALEAQILKLKAEDSLEASQDADLKAMEKRVKSLEVALAKSDKGQKIDVTVKGPTPEISKKAIFSIETSH